jgi:hypothetical protein
VFLFGYRPRSIVGSGYSRSISAGGSWRPYLLVFRVWLIRSLTPPKTELPATIANRRPKLEKYRGLNGSRTAEPRTQQDAEGSVEFPVFLAYFFHLHRNQQRPQRQQDRRAANPTGRRRTTQEAQVRSFPNIISRLQEQSLHFARAGYLLSRGRSEFPVFLAFFFSSPPESAAASTAAGPPSREPHRTPKDDAGGSGQIVPEYHIAPTGTEPKIATVFF